MKKRIVKILVRLGWWRLAYRISASLAQYHAGALCGEGLAAAVTEKGKTHEC